jgi:SAM-dependent methyltransferase
MPPTSLQGVAVVVISMSDVPYDSAFFEFHQERSRSSARETVPLVLEIVEAKSVVDVGCGIGTWLAEFATAGVTDVTGVDGEYVDRSKLLVDPSRFVPKNLEQPLELGRQFDLAVSLEVAEHLAESSADTFVASLVSLAPVVLFSAAIPNDSGDGHVNEQFPEYWQERFLRHDYVVVDCLRRRLWNNEKVAPYYRQDMMFYVARGRLGEFPILEQEFRSAGERPPLSFVHPETYLAMARKMRESQCMAMRYAARLREINLIVLPDWGRATPSLITEIRALLRAVVTHPEAKRIALLVSVAGERADVAEQTLAMLVSEAQRDWRPAAGAAPELAGIGKTFGPDQWEVLGNCMQYRVPIAGEDRQIALRRGIAQLPTLSIAALAARQPLVGRQARNSQ